MTCVAPAGKSGTVAGYKVCHCAACRAANAAYHRARRRSNAYGRRLSVPGEETVARVLELLAAGHTPGTIARAAGLPGSTVKGLAVKRPRTVFTATATAIATLDAPPPLSPKVDGAGTRRRLQALAAVGWPIAALARHLGRSPSLVARWYGQECRVSRTTARRVSALYDELWNRTPPGGTHHERANRTRTRAAAAERGWPPPLAWDDDTIDDPDAAPAGARPGGSGPAAWSDVVMLIEDGATWETLTARIGASRDALERRIARHGRSDLLARLTERNVLRDAA